MYSLCLIFFIAEETSRCCQTIKEQIKKQLLDSFVYDENINKEDFSARVDTVKDCQEARKIIEEWDDIIKTNKKNIIRFAYEPGNIFKKFKEDT